MNEAQVQEILDEYEEFDEAFCALVDKFGSEKPVSAAVFYFFEGDENARGAYHIAPNVNEAAFFGLISKFAFFLMRKFADNAQLKRATGEKTEQPTGPTIWKN